jgi:hypothetical protein
MLRRIFETKREEMMGESRGLHNEELSSLNTIRIMKSKRMRWAGHMTHIGEVMNTYKIFGRKI